MKISGRKVKFLFLIIFIFIFIFFAGSVSAAVIKEVKIVDSEGDIYDASSAATFISFSSGDKIKNRKYLIDSIADDVDKMKKSGLYSFIDSYLLEDDDGIVIVYEVIPKYKLRRIEIRGCENISSKKIRKKSELILGQLADDVVFEDAIFKMKKAYRDYWYPHIKINWASNIDYELGEVDVVFDISEGEKVGIQNIIFQGNNLIDRNELIASMMQKEKNYLSFITDEGRFYPEYIDSDLFALKNIYLNKGFLDIEIEYPELSLINSPKSELLYKIDEGRHYQIRNILVTGIADSDLQELIVRIPLSKGQSASYRFISMGSEAIKSYFGNRGFINISVNISYETDPAKGIVDIEYQVKEGKKAQIGNISINGNKQTLDEVIRRELVFLPGEDYNKSRITASENRLRNLNYFEMVNINTESKSNDQFYDVNIRVKEKPTGQFNAGVGMSSVDKLMGYIDLSQGNFRFGTWPPVGGGQKFQARFQIGTRRNDVEFSFIEPWFQDKKLSFGINAYHRESRYFSEVYDQVTDGVRISLGKPINQYMRHSIAYKFEQYKVENVESASAAVQAEEGKRLSSGIEYIFSYDTRNKPFATTQGNRSTISPYIHGGILGGETDIYGIKLKTSQFTPLIWNMVFVNRFQFNSVNYYGDMEIVPIFDRLFLGGTYNLRGYEYREVGPRDNTQSDSIGGNTSIFASSELTFPIWDKIRGAIFYDWGVVNPESADFDLSKYNDNYGFGILIDMPGFPLRLDYAWPIEYHEERGETGKGQFNFLMGYIY